MFVFTYTVDSFLFTFEALLGNEKSAFMEAIQDLQNNGVTFIDEYNVIKTISDPDNNLWEVIDDIITKNGLGYK